MILESYIAQHARWPASGRHILAQYDDESIVVYQAYRPSIGRFAAEHGYFGGEFSLSRMSWIKPNFLWMMYRCGWASKEGQEVVLAVTIARALFDEIVSIAVSSSEIKVKSQPLVRCQWDPDHAPNGAPVERRAIQLGLRGEMLERYARPLKIEDISAFVREQHENLRRGGIDALVTPREDVYPS